MTIKRKGILKASIKSCIDILCCLFGTIWICLYRSYSTTFDTFCTMSNKVCSHPSSLQLPNPVALSSKIFCSYLSASHMYTIIDGIHLCSAHVDCMNQLMGHGLSSMCFILYILLT